MLLLTAGWFPEFPLKDIRRPGASNCGDKQKEGCDDRYYTHTSDTKKTLQVLKKIFNLSFCVVLFSFPVPIDPVGVDVSMDFNLASDLPRTIQGLNLKFKAIQKFSPHHMFEPFC